ncbi:MAG TPA: M56 family metallopeptidase, partial [Vicinamibacterales bacterium]
MIAHAANHLWQSTLFAGAMALLALVLRRNGAHVRYWLWLGASIKFFVPFAIFMGLGAFAAAPAPAPSAFDSTRAAMTVAVDRVAQPFAVVEQQGLTTNDSNRQWILTTGVSVWMLGITALVVMRVRAWRRVRRAVHASVPIDISGASGTVKARSTPGLLEPGVVGLWRPVLLVPANIADYLTPPQLDAVVAHELCHLRRCDNLTSAVHMLVETVFWFHPLVWWIGARLVDERERACDEAVLRLGLEPRDYAEGILNVCRLFMESPLACVPGVSGANVRKRIEDIMSHHTGVGLNVTRRFALVAAAVAALTAPVIAGLVTAPLHQEPKFEVASIRPCENGPIVPGGRGGGGGPIFSPGSFVFNCGTLQALINAAYVQNGEGLLNDDPGAATGANDAASGRIRGGPDWARTAR